MSRALVAGLLLLALGTASTPTPAPPGDQPTAALTSTPTDPAAPTTGPAAPTGPTGPTAPTNAPTTVLTGTAAPTDPAAPTGPTASTGPTIGQTGPAVAVPSQVVHGTRAVVSGWNASSRLLQDLARRADRAAKRVAEVLGGTITPRILVPDSAAQAAQLAGVGSVDGLAAMADGDRVIVVPGAFAELTPTGRDVVLTHELTHVAAGTANLPPWLYEGFADYVAYKKAGLPVPVAAAELAKEVRAGRLPGELPGPAAFAPGAVRLAQTYQEAWLACRFVAARFGEERLVRLYREARAHGADRALPATVGMDVARLTRMWRDYLREQLG